MVNGFFFCIFNKKVQKIHKMISGLNQTQDNESSRAVPEFTTDSLTKQGVFFQLCWIQNHKLQSHTVYIKCTFNYYADIIEEKKQLF